MYYFEIWRFPDLIEDNRNKTFIKTLADFFAEKIGQSLEFLIQNSILILTRSRQNRNALQMLMLFQSVTRYFSSHDNMTISVFFIYYTDLFLVICCVQRTKKHEWSDFAVKSIILWCFHFKYSRKTHLLEVSWRRDISPQASHGQK